MSEVQRADLRLEHRGDVLWVLIDREARRNAINSAVLSGIAAPVWTIRPPTLGVSYASCAPHPCP